MKCARIFGLTGVTDEAVEAKHRECSIFNILLRFEDRDEVVEQAHTRCSSYPRIRKNREHVYKPSSCHEAHRA